MGDRRHGTVRSEASSVDRRRNTSGADRAPYPPAQQVMMECLRAAIRDLRRAALGVRVRRPRIFQIWRSVRWPYIHYEFVRFDCLRLEVESLLSLDDDRAAAYKLMEITRGYPRRVLHVYRQLRAAQRWCEEHGSR